MILLGYSIRSDLHALQFVHHAASMLLYPFTTCNTNISVEDRNAIRVLNSNLLNSITGHDTKEDTHMWVGLCCERRAYLYYFVPPQLNEQFFYLRTRTESASQNMGRSWDASGVHTYASRVEWLMHARQASIT